MSREKIVVIEDEADISEVITYNLARAGYEVRATDSGDAGLEMIRAELPDAVLLDIMLPGHDGLEVCKALKADPLTRAIPVVMVTAKGEESDIVRGLGMGADDYVTKPFSPKELIARVAAVLRRGPLKADGGTHRRVQIGGVAIDSARHEVRVDGEPVAFTATELRLFHFLASHPGRVFTRDQLLTRAVGEDAVVFDRNIDVHIAAIRRKLGTSRDLIETIRGVGYRLRDL